MMTPTLASFSIGLLAGAAWNLASFWCLRRLLAAWIGPRASQPRAIGWVVAKLAVLYPSAYLMLRHPLVSPIGFGLGFTLVLLAGMGLSLAQAQRRIAHGR